MTLIESRDPMRYQAQFIRANGGIAWPVLLGVNNWIPATLRHFMSQTLISPLLGLDETFPELLYVLHHPASNRYGCYFHEGIHGLASFSTEQGALRFAEWIDLVGMTTREVSFDEAREVAKDRPLPVVSLMLLDSLQSPKIHFVR